MEKRVHGTLTVSPETGAFSVLHHEDAAWQNGKQLWQVPG